MSPIIRPYRPGDEFGMAYAHSQSILKLNAADYPAELIIRWASKKPEMYTEMVEKGERYFVAETPEMIVGLSGWLNDDLSVCYLYPALVGQGLGRKLFEVAEADYLAQTGNKRLKVNSTITAKPFYEKMGFTALEPVKDYFSDGTTYLDAWKMEKTYA